MINYNSPDFVRSRRAYIAQSVTEHFVYLLVTDAYLAKLLAHIGMSDALIGIVSSFVTLAFVFQIMSLFVVKMKIGAKRTVMLFDTVSIFFFMLMYFVPLMPVPSGAKSALIIVSILIAYFGRYTIFSLCYKWANSYVDPLKRGAFTSVKEIISLVAGIAFSLVAGYFVDRFDRMGNMEGLFLFIAILLFAVNICNFTALFKIKKENEDMNTDGGEPIRVVLKNTLGNKNFKSVIKLTVLWEVAKYFTVGFIGVFKTKDLMISILGVQLINIAGNLTRAVISKSLGRFSDKHSYAKGFKLGLLLATGAFFINMFTTRTSWFLIIPYTVLYCCATGGVNQNSFNITYSYVDMKYVTQAMAIKNCIGGLCGFGASLVAGKILDTIQANGNMIFGVHIYGQQLLSGISLIVTIIAILYVKTVIEKQKIIVQ